jgi:hypothetical protein
VGLLDLIVSKAGGSGPSHHQRQIKEKRYLGGYSAGQKVGGNKFTELNTEASEQLTH